MLSCNMYDLSSCACDSERSIIACVHLINPCINRDRESRSSPRCTFPLSPWAHTESSPHTLRMCWALSLIIFLPQVAVHQLLLQLYLNDMRLLLLLLLLLLECMMLQELFLLLLLLLLMVVQCPLPAAAAAAQLQVVSLVSLSLSLE